MKSNQLKLFTFVIAFLLIHSNTSAQKKLYATIEYPSELKLFSKLSKKVNESSGVILYQDCIWTFNDSGGEPELYKTDKKTGKVIKTVRIINGTNHDWEDITQDDEYIYVGDFGNNRGNRKNLAIYKILKKDIGKGEKVDVNAEIISFSYNDQQSFEMKRQKNNFDCEAITGYGDSLIIFSKDWADRKSRMYKLPKVPGDYKIDPVDVFNVNGLITGADYNSSTGDLILVGYKDYVPFVFLFNGFYGNDFAAAKIFRINFPAMKDAQTEGVVWSDDDNIVITCEDTKAFKQSAFQLNIREAIKQSDGEK